MSPTGKTLRESVIDFCAHIGADRLLVQGPGGNVSWKDGDTLWVKASGTWLADAARKAIFVPVNLADLNSAMAAREFKISPRVHGHSGLRPSIETALHALMPHKVVVHLHAVEILAHLVRSNSDAEIGLLAGESFRWLSVGYFKPGADLARAIHQAMKQSPDVDVVFLKSHGVVVGGAGVREVDDSLRRLISNFKTQPRSDIESNVSTANSSELGKYGYRLSQDRDIHNLAIDGRLFRRLRKDWALYPDHVVFLGPRATHFDHPDDFIARLAHSHDLPELVFIRGVGVLEGAKFTDAERAQIKCYYDVLLRQADDEHLNSLRDEDIAQLLDWDAEKYRMSMSPRLPK